MARFGWAADVGWVQTGRVGVPRELIPAIAALTISAGLDGYVAVRVPWCVVQADVTRWFSDRG